MHHQSSRLLKLAGTGLLAVPIVILALFTVGEVLGGDLSGLQHAVQMAPLLLLAWFSWQRPRLGGIALIGLALLFAVVYFVLSRDFPPGTRLTAGILLFAMPLVAGILFLLASRQPDAARSGNSSAVGPRDPW